MTYTNERNNDNNLQWSEINLLYTRYFPDLGGQESGGEVIHSPIQLIRVSSHKQYFALDIAILLKYF